MTYITLDSLSISIFNLIIAMSAVDETTFGSLFKKMLGFERGVEFTNVTRVKLTTAVPAIFDALDVERFSVHMIVFALRQV